MISYILIGSIILTMMGLVVIAFIVYYQRRQMQHQQKTQLLMLKNSIDVQETVRRKISNDLHDEIGGLLSATKLSISLLEKSSDDSIKDKIGHSKKLVSEALTKVRSLSRDLIPRTLENFGMTSAIEEFAHKMEQASQVEIHFKETNIGEKERFNPNLELTAYRIIQELTNNSLKHAAAKNIRIEIIKNNMQIEISFRDDGKGFKMKNTIGNKEKGLGLGNIISRLKVIDGNYQFNSKPNLGIEFFIQLPINQHE